MAKHPQRFWLVALVVAWAIDFLFWDKPIGLSLFLFAALALAGGYYLAYSEAERPARFSIVLSGLVLFMAGAAVLRSEPFTRVLSAFLAAGGLLLLVMTFRSGAWVRFRVFDYVVAGSELFFVSFFRAAGLPLIPKSENGAPRRAALRQVFPVVRGFVLALPVVVLLGALLASADLVFADQMNAFFNAFDLAKVPEYMFRWLYILFFAYVFAGYYLQAVKPSRWGSSRLPAPEKAVVPDGPSPEGASDPAASIAAASPDPMHPAPAVQRILGSTEAFVVLGSVNVLYVLFVAIQFRYFFGGQANITAAGYTYSEYARRGFFELVWVAVISLMLFLVLSAITRRETPSRARVFTGLSILLVSLVLVMLVSAFQRLLLYEDAYGFTSLRTYTHVFIPWLGFLLLGTIVLEVLRRDEFFGAMLLFSAFGFGLSMSAINIDAFIVRQNVARARAGLALDGAYLLTLSDDALPALAREYTRGDHSPAVKETLGAVLSCRTYAAAGEEARPWQSYHPGQAAARRSLVGLDLSAYPIRKDANGAYVKTAKDKFSCTPPRGMD